MIRCMAIDGLLFLVQLNNDMTFVKHHRVFSRHHGQRLMDPLVWYPRSTNGNYHADRVKSMKIDH